ncbi:MAG: acyltransferase family protein [Thermoleophilia bacterium]
MTTLPRDQRHANIEVMRALAILAVFGFHFLGFWQAANGNLNVTHGPLGRVHRILLLYGGTWGVSVFVVLSGLGLVAGMSKTATVGAFYRRRLLRVFPLFWWIAVPTIVLLLALGRMPVSLLWQTPFWLTGTAIAAPGRLWPISASWWFITLIVQIYLVFPLLWWIARRFGLAAVMAVAVFVNGVTLAVISWSGAPWGHAAASFVGLAFVGSRLIELTAGLCLGALYWPWVEGKRPSASTFVSVGLALPIAYLVLRRFMQPPWSQPYALGFVILMLPRVVRTACATRVMRPLLWLGNGSYAFYLAHAVWTALTVAALTQLGLQSELLTLLAALAVATAVSALFARSYGVAAAKRFGLAYVKT